MEQDNNERRLVPPTDRSVVQLSGHVAPLLLPLPPSRRLVLPTSDWDVILFGVDGSSRNMHRLGAEIEARGLASKLEVIDSARVPIIKLTERESGISIDLSFESAAASGVVTRSLINDFIRRCVGGREQAWIGCVCVERRRWLALGTSS
jgi:hypothetical protein